MVMANAGSAIMGIGTGSGEGRAVNAARHAITSPLLEASIEGARGILLNIAGGSDLTLFEVNEAAAIIHDVAHPDANIIFGNVVDESLGDLVRVTVIAAGFDRNDEAEDPRRFRGAGRPSGTPGAAGRQPVRAGLPREPQGYAAGSGGEGARADPQLPGESRGDLPEVFPSRDDLSDERDVFASGDDDLDLDDDFDVPSFLK
jgi:cell division protein FtsZ